MPNLAQTAITPGAEAPSRSDEVTFGASVMLWTVGTELAFDQRLEMVAEAGYHAVELVGEYQTWSEDDFGRYNEKRRSLGIVFDATASAMVAPGRSRHNASDPRQRDDFLADIRADLRMMEKVECPDMIVMAGDRMSGLSAHAQHDGRVEALTHAAELAEPQGVRILVENVDLEENPDYLAQSMEAVFQLVRDVDRPNVKVCYDLFHAQLSGGNLIANLERHIDLVGKVHIGDVPGHHEPGTGEINFANIYKKLAELGYDGYVTMEFLPTGDPVTTLAYAREAALLAAQS